MENSEKEMCLYLEAQTRPLKIEICNTVNSKPDLKIDANKISITSETAALWRLKVKLMRGNRLIQFWVGWSIGLLSSWLGMIIANRIL